MIHMKVASRSRRAAASAVVVTFALLGGGFATAAFASGKPPPPHPSPHGQPTSLEAWSTCTASLCIDAPPDGPSGLDGSGGWGYNNTINAPVTTLTVGQPASFVVTQMEPNPAGVSGTITLSYSSQDFSLSSTDSRGVTGSDPFDRGGVMVFNETADYFSHTDTSDSFTFTPQNPTSNALVTATVDVAGQQASETFPVVIVAP
jgi:hypothetical protein